MREKRAAIVGRWIVRRYIYRMEQVRPDGFVITDDRARIDVARVHRWLSEESYWAAGSSLDVVTRSIQGSISLGCFAPDGQQVGITRLITDGAVFALISDVFVDSEYRGLGLGKFLVQTAVEHPEVQGVRRMLLATSDAHELYRRFGFSELSTPERWMEMRSSSTLGAPPRL
jgi:GNAT superfamily N-acetyltransferase